MPHLEPLPAYEVPSSDFDMNAISLGLTVRGEVQDLVRLWASVNR
jgi:hypothetical protein